MKKNYLKQLRQSLEFSTQDISKEIGVSRPTYVAIENGSKDMTLSQAEKLAGLFNLSFEDFLNKKDPKKYIFKTKKSKKAKKSNKSDIRVSVPEEKVDKFKQTLLYILEKVGGRRNIGQTVIYKLLYFIDFDYYEKYEKQLIGAKYIKNTYGPTPVMFAKIISELEADGEIETIKSKFYKREQTKYLVNPSRELNVSALSAQELAHIDMELDRLSHMTATKISALSHIDTPWLVAGEMEELKYEHVFYRPEETSVRTYEQL